MVVLYAYTEVRGCLAPQTTARGLARSRSCLRDDDATTDISPSLHNDPHARGYGCGREAVRAACRSAYDRARDTLLGCRGRHSRDAGALDETSAISSRQSLVKQK